jgi:hypothetical protein
MTEQLTENSLKPIACTFCSKYVTYIQFDLELHLYEIHNIRSDSRIEYAINEGKELGLKINPTLLHQLNEDFLAQATSKQFLSSGWTPAPTSQEVIRPIQGMKSWSQLDNSFTFTPNVSVEKFFNDDLQLPLRDHPLEKSPCYPIVDFKPAGKYILYFCELHPKTENVNLESIEHHCKYDNPAAHKTEIISRMDKVNR